MTWRWLLESRRFFRVAAPAGFAWNYAKTMLQTTILWAVFLFGLPGAIAAFEHRVLDVPTLGEARLVGALVFGAFGGLGLWGGFVMARVGRGTPLPLDAAPVLVVAGPYRHVRNPMAISAPMQAIGVSLWLDSTLVLLYGGAAALLWNFVIRPPEELDLQERFGTAYDRYRDNVRCWVPRIPGFDL